MASFHRQRSRGIAVLGSAGRRNDGYSERGGGSWGLSCGGRGSRCRQTVRELRWVALHGVEHLRRSTVGEALSNESYLLDFSHENGPQMLTAIAHLVTQGDAIVIYLHMYYDRHRTRRC